MRRRGIGIGSGNSKKMGKTEAWKTSRALMALKTEFKAVCSDPLLRLLEYCFTSSRSSVVNVLDTEHPILYLTPCAVQRMHNNQTHFPVPAYAFAVLLYIHFSVVEHRCTTEASNIRQGGKYHAGSYIFCVMVLSPPLGA